MLKRRMKVVDALQLAMERERGANRFYLQAAEATGNQNGKNMFTGWPRRN